MNKKLAIILAIFGGLVISISVVTTLVALSLFTEPMTEKEAYPLIETLQYEIDNKICEGADIDLNKRQAVLKCPNLLFTDILEDRLREKVNTSVDIFIDYNYSNNMKLVHIT